MGNIECILATVNNLSDSDLKILANLIMDRLNPEKAFASPVKIVPRMECPVCHTSAHVVRWSQTWQAGISVPGMWKVICYNK